MSFLDNEGVPDDGLSLLCCKKCRGLFVFVDMLKEHVGQCNGDPKTSQCQLFACKKDWFVWCSENWNTRNRNDSHSQRQLVADSSGVHDESEPANDPRSRTKNDLSGAMSPIYSTPSKRFEVIEEDEFDTFIKMEMPDSISKPIDNGSAPVSSNNATNYQLDQTMPILRQESRPPSMDNRTVLTALGQLVNKQGSSPDKSSSGIRGNVNEGITLPLNFAGKRIMAGLLPKGKHSRSTSSDLPQTSNNMDSQMYITIEDSDVEDGNSTDAYSEPEKFNESVESVTLPVQNEQPDSPGLDSRLSLSTRAGKPFYKCIECNQGSGDQKKMEKHLKAHDTGALFSCRFCSYHTMSKGILVQHEKKHTSVECEVCGMKFKSQYLLQKHFGLSHADLSAGQIPITNTTNRRKSRAGTGKKRKAGYIDGDSAAEMESNPMFYDMNDVYSRQRNEEENVEDEEFNNEVHYEDENYELPDLPYTQEIKTE
ncbi:hypothetical protein ScPMuIL_017961 [Solemya velum]